MMKGQSTIEFLGTSMMFIALLGTIIMVASDSLPRFDSEVEEASLNMELQTLTTKMLTQPGETTGGSSDWERNPDLIETFGLADKSGEVERSKIQALDDSSNSPSTLNYTEFRSTENIENEYRMVFTWYPIVESSKTFTRTNSPSKIQEPTTSEYTDDGNTVHYGSAMINGQDMKFLVTSHDNVYDTVYISPEWNFLNAEPRVEGEVVDIQGQNFTVSEFQNRDENPGNLVIFSKNLNDFGAIQGQASTVIKLNRYAILKDVGSDDFPLKIEVLAW
ncbi:MAG: hypothetical protein ACI977_000433 [Candidatus Nanohaloarchaea archaeon]|jgi:hypothetical protein